MGVVCTAAGTRYWNPGLIHTGPQAAKFMDMDIGSISSHAVGSCFVDALHALLQFVMQVCRLQSSPLTWTI